MSRIYFLSHFYTVSTCNCLQHRAALTQMHGEQWTVRFSITVSFEKHGPVSLTSSRRWTAVFILEALGRTCTPQSLYYCLFAPHIPGVVLRAHSVRGKTRTQRNACGGVAIASPPFSNEPHRAHVLFVKASHGTTFTSWSQHHFVAIGKPEWQVRKASHCGRKQR